MRLLLAAVLAIAVAAVGFSRIQGPDEQGIRRAPSVAAQTSVSTDAARADGAELQPVPTSDGAASAPSGDLAVSTTPALGQQPPKESRLEGRASESSLPRDSATAGAPVSYTDPADDADGLAANPALSQPAFDILEVRWAPASEVDEQQRGYSASITVAGAARNDGTYVTYGEFTSDVPGERCQLYHFLTPGRSAFANAFCGTVDDGTRRLVGRVQGSQVTSTPTAAGGTLLIATFDDSALPPLLESGGRILFRLSAFTCAADPEGPAPGLRCGSEETLDDANTFHSYRL
jgi:hypothetical protein